jgi:hypothetical protein
MNWRSISALAVAGLVIACDIPFLRKEQAADTTAAVRPPVAAAQPVDTAPPAPAEPMQAAPSTRLTGGQPLMDEPWTPTDTGTVDPGMSRDQVVTLWGQPVAERAAGAWTYLYYRNGCEVSCGTFDVVFFENGQVVDAIVRSPGHGYAGTSTSPPGREPAANVPRPAQGGAE